MAKAVLDNLKSEPPKNHFTIGIIDDVTKTHLEWDDEFTTETEGTHRALFFGLGADGTVGANKNSIKIIGKATDNYAQGYFVYDSKKSGARTVSHLRFGKQPIRSTYLIQKADFLACHNFSFVDRYNMLDHVMAGGTFIDGSTSEFSADGPLREPYVLYAQGGTTAAHAELALEQALEVVGVEAGAISVLDEDTSELVFRVQQGWRVHDFVSQGVRVPAESS